MRRVLLWMAMAVLCCTPFRQVAPARPGVDPRLPQAQAEFEAAANLKAAGRYADAIPKAERALSLRESALGATHVEVARCLGLLGELHRLKGGYAHAEQLLLRSLSILETSLGKAHPDVATTLNSLGQLHTVQGQYERAESLHERALSIRESSLGHAHPDVATSLNNLALVHMQQGRYDSAEPLYERALSIREAALGKTHPDVAVTLAYLGLLCTYQGQYSRAVRLQERALSIREAALDKGHPDVAMSLGSLGLVYTHLGQYARSEVLYERALSIREAALGKMHLHVAISLIHMANLYLEQGDTARAKPLFERALVIQEAALGKSHPDVAITLNNLGMLHRTQGQYGHAMALYERALSIREAGLGKSHPDIAQSLHNIGYLHTLQGQHDRAMALLERALSIREAVFGQTHPEVARSFHVLAGLYAKQGKYGRAGALYERELAILEETVGKGHPYVAFMLDDFAQLRLRQRRLADALHLYRRTIENSEGQLRTETLSFSESRLASFLQSLDEQRRHLYSLVRAHPDNPDVRRLALTAVLLFKGRSVEEAASTSRATLRSLGPEDRDRFERLRGLRTRLATLSLDGPGKLPPADYQRQMRELANQCDTLETDLARRSAPLRALTALPSPGEIVERVASALPREGVLLQFVAYADHPTASSRDLPESTLPSRLRYLAMVLFPDGRTGAVDLGPAAPIDMAALRLRDALASREAGFQGATQKLHQLVFRPLLPLLGKARRLFIVPDGELSLVPFAALHDGRRFLADTFDHIYLTGGRDLLPRPGDTPGSRSVVILADPDYDASTPPVQASVGGGTVTMAAAERSYSVERFFAQRRADLFEQPWESLPGTREEAESIRRLLPQARLFVGAQASKEHLLNLASPGILHIATHGFFLDDAPAAPGGRGLATVGQLGGSVPTPPDPLLRSGLVLAGAGTAADPGHSMATALELAGLDLWGTELVVLSACDTGRGEVKRGLGVYGLRRAFVVAGVETLVVSLWKVDDETTRIMMERYYHNLLAGQGRAEALKGAMVSLRARHPHPYFWAPFIALGRDAPLPAVASTP